jgi:hypothetical protein
MAVILVVIDHYKSATCCAVPDISTPETTQITTSNTAIKQDNNNEPHPHPHVHTQTHIQSKQSELALILVVLDHDQSASCCVVPDMSTPETTQITTTSTAKATRNHKKHMAPTPTHVEKIQGRLPWVMAILDGD